MKELVLRTGKYSTAILAMLFGLVLISITLSNTSIKTPLNIALFLLDIIAFLAISFTIIMLILAGDRPIGFYSFLIMISFLTVAVIEIYSTWPFASLLAHAPQLNDFSPPALILLLPILVCLAAFFIRQRSGLGNNIKIWWVLGLGSFLTSHLTLLQLLGSTYPLPQKPPFQFYIGLAFLALMLLLLLSSIFASDRLISSQKYFSAVTISVIFLLDLIGIIAVIKIIALKVILIVPLVFVLIIITSFFGKGLYSLVKHYKDTFAIFLFFFWGNILPLSIWLVYTVSLMWPVIVLIPMYILMLLSALLIDAMDSQRLEG